MSYLTTVSAAKSCLSSNVESTVRIVPEKDWSHHKCGFMIRFDNSALLMLKDADEDLAIVTRFRAKQ